MICTSFFDLTGLVAFFDSSCESITCPLSHQSSQNNQLCYHRPHKKLSHQSFVKNAQQTSTSLHTISHQQPIIMNPLSDNNQLDDCRALSNHQLTSTANPIFSSLSIDNSHAQRPRSASSDSSNRYKKISRTIDTIDAVLDLVDMDDFGDFDLIPSSINCTAASSHQ